MKTTYYPVDDILEIRFSNEPVSREVSCGWNLSISFASDGSVVEVLILEARKTGLDPTLLEDMQDLQEALRLKDEPSVSWESVKTQLGLE
jgi:hypothetical protein